MNEKDIESAEQVKRERKPYTEPRIEESGRFEHMVLDCSLAEGPECSEGEFSERSVF